MVFKLSVNVIAIYRCLTKGCKTKKQEYSDLVVISSLKLVGPGLHLARRGQKFVQTTNTSALECRRNRVRVLPVTSSDVPLVAKAIASLGQILLQEPNRLPCGAPGLLVPGGTNGELTKEHHIKNHLTHPNP
jgi:hypothetical protein